MATSLTTVSGLPSLSKELCIVCQSQPYDLICTCGDKFDFTCIHKHVEQIGLEFQYTQNEVGERLIQIEQIIEENDCDNAKTIVENWKRKLIQHINDIADDALNTIAERENVYSGVAPFRVEYNTLAEESNRVVHEQLNSIIALQRQIFEKSDELATLPELLRDEISLDSKIQSKLNPNIINQTSTTHYMEPMISSSMTTTNPLVTTEPLISVPITTSNTHTLMNTEEEIPASTMDIEPTVKFSTNDRPAGSTSQDEFEIGLTAHIQRQNPTIISTNNDKYAGTICCHENQLLFNDCNPGGQNARLALIPNVTQPTIRLNINWPAPDSIIGGGDDNWIQDITYSTRLRGYLLLNRSRLRLLHDNTHELEEFYQFPDRSMKRVTCNDNHIYLIVAAGATAQNGDEIIMLDYNKRETVCKTFRDIVLSRNNRIVGPLIAEISDLAVNDNDQIMISYRLERRQEVGVRVYNITNDGNDWVQVKQLLLNECWHINLSQTPRIEWCEKLNVFMLVEHMTGHLIMLDQTGQVKGECSLTHTDDRKESPLNITVSTNDWLCVRYASSIDIHRLEDARL